MKVLRRMSRSQRRCLTTTAAALLLLLVLVYRENYGRTYRWSNLNSPDCVFPNDDPNCKHRVTDPPPPPPPPTKDVPDSLVGAEWCPDVVGFEKPEFSDGREPQTWQSVRHRNLTVFSAFLDGRRRIGGPLVRIVASGLQEQFNVIGPLFCSLWYADRDRPATVGPVVYDRIYPSLFHPEMWVAHFVLCPLPVTGGGGGGGGGHPPPFAVSVTSSRCEAKPSNALMLLNRRIPPALEDSAAADDDGDGDGERGGVSSSSFAACFAPVYGKTVNWTVFVEWIELHRILGVRTAYFYNYTMDAGLSRVLRAYAEEKQRVEVVQWKYPQDKLSNYFSQHEAINDCLYRAGREHRYVAVVDVDEVVAPRKHANWTAMMRSLARPKVGAYLFQHTYFRRNSTGEKPYLITQQSLWRTDVVAPPGKIRCKTVYAASKAVKANIHFPYSLAEGFDEYLVPPEVAVLHHYRPEPMESFRNHPEQFRFVEDKLMRRYNKQLTARVRKRLGD